MSGNILELACFNYQDAVTAAEAGVGRIELCKDYNTGGLTPEPSEVYKLKKQFDTPIFVMIQPRIGGYYYKDEFNKKAMVETVHAFKDAGADGFVFGAIELDSKGKTIVDVEKTEFFRNTADGLPCTFHRAIQEIDDQKSALEQLIQMGYNRILTSGLHGRAIEHIDHIIHLKKLANDRIIILPGGGIRSDHLHIFLQSGFKEVHSASVNSKKLLDVEELKRMIKVVNEYGNSRKNT